MTYVLFTSIFVLVLFIIVAFSFSVAVNTEKKVRLGKSRSEALLESIFFM